MRYYRSRERDDAENAAFRLYAAKKLHIIAETVGHIHLPDYAELIEMKPVDNRTGDEIAADIIKRAGLTFGGDGA